MAGTHSSSMSLGDDSATDMTSGGETGTSNPWFEFSDLDLTFVPEGQPIMRRRGGVPGTVPGKQPIGRGW